MKQVFRGKVAKVAYGILGVVALIAAALAPGGAEDN